MSIFDWFKRQAKPAMVSPSIELPPSGDGTTTADRPDFTLNLPFRWDAVAAEEGYEFRNQTLPEQIIVTVLPHQRELANVELEPIITQLVAARRSAISKISAGGACLSETSLRRADRQIEARVTGEDAASAVRLAFVIRVTPKKTVTAALNRYTLQEVGTPFADYATLIFDLFHVKDN